MFYESFFLLRLRCISKPTICPCMEYCCRVWAGDPSCYLELVDKLQKQICRTADPSLAASFEPLTHHWNMASLSLFYRYYFGRWSSELTQLVPLPHSPGRSAHFSDRLHEFSVTIPRMSMSTVSFLAQLGSGILHLFFVYTYSFFPKRFHVCFNIFVLLFLVTPYLVVAVQPCMEWIPIKKIISFKGTLKQILKFPYMFMFI